jgi:tight adherence protein C
MLTLIDYIVFGFGAVILLAWLLFFFVGLKHAKLFDVLDEKEYPFKEIYFVGYAVVQMIKYPYKSKYDRKLRKEISVLYGDKYADYYIRVIYAQKITMAFTLLALAAPMYGLSNEIVAAVIMVVFSGLAYYYFGTVTANKILKRSEEMLNEFSNVVSKLALLTNAGMIMREAWEEVAYTGDTALYKEMQRAVDEMKNGFSEIDALSNFGSRCILPEIKKFTSTITQGLVKGNRELVFMLQDQSKEVWSAKKHSVKRQGEKAASKLLIPIMLMFIGILIMVIVPIFTNMGI